MDATQHIGCAHMASDGCVRVAYGYALYGDVAYLMYDPCGTNAMSKAMVHEHKAAALPCVVCYVRWASGQGRKQGSDSRVWAAGELRHDATAARNVRSLARSERKLACDEGCAQRW